MNSQNCWSEPHLDLLSADCDMGVRQITHELKHAHANLNCSLCAQSFTKSVVRLFHQSTPSHEVQPGAKNHLQYYLDDLMIVTLC